MTAGLGKGYAAGVRIGWDPIAAEKPWSIDPRTWRVVHLYGGIGVGNGFGFGASIGNGQVPQGPWGGMIAGAPWPFRSRDLSVPVAAGWAFQAAWDSGAVRRAVSGWAWATSYDRHSHARHGPPGRVLAPRYTNDCASVVGAEGAYPPPN